MFDRIFNRALLTLLLTAGLLGGCAPTKTLPRFVWPAPPETPRLEYVGNYYSENDFKKSAGEELLAKMVGEDAVYSFRTPFGIVSNSKGVVYISDVHLKNVRVFDFNNRTIEFLLKQPMMKAPAGMAIDEAGNLYIADSQGGAVYVFSPDGTPLAKISDPEHLSQPAYVAIDPAGGDVYVSDGGGHRIVVFERSGKYRFSFGQRGQGEGEFLAPQGLAFGPDGNLYVADMLNARVQVLTPQGKFVRMFGERGDGVWQLENPKDLAFDSDGNLYVIDSRRSDLLTYTPDGKLLLSTGEAKPTTSPFGFSTPKSVFIDRNDRIYVTEALGKRFSVWQYMSAAYLQQHPFTEADKQKLQEHMREVLKEKEGGR